MTAPIMPERARDAIVPIRLPKAAVGLSLWHGDLYAPKRWSMADILEIVSDAYRISVADLRGARRTRAYAWPRQHAMWLMAQQPHLSLPMIGRFLGGRDHTTVLHGVRAHAARIAAEWSGREAA